MCLASLHKGVFFTYLIDRNVDWNVVKQQVERFFLGLHQTEITLR